MRQCYNATNALRAKSDAPPAIIQEMQLNLKRSVILKYTAGLVSLAATMAVMLCMSNSWAKYMIVVLFFSGDFIVWKYERAALAAKRARQEGDQSGRFKI